MPYRGGITPLAGSGTLRLFSQPAQGRNAKQIAQDMGKYVNSLAWRGDPPR